MSKHTKGPWYLDKYGNLKADASNDSLRMVGFSGVCSTSGHEANANTRLISAAPEMLEALEVSRNVLAKQLRFSAPERFETEAQVREHAVIKQMDQAIKKARGEK